MTPDSWKQRTIAELCEMVKGSAPISKTKAGEFPLVTTGEERKTADYYQFDTAAVCVPMISSTGHGHASLKRVQYQEGKFALSNLLTALIVRDQSSLSPRFLHLYLNYFKDKLIVPLMAGAANMSITVGRLATVPVRFPPLAEQERILRALDEAGELGRLRAQADRRTADLIHAIFYEMFGDPVINPQDLKTELLGNLGYGEDAIVDGPFGSSINTSIDYIANGEIPVIRTKNVRPFEFITDDLKFMSRDKFNLVKRSRVVPGDIILTKVGTIGNVCIFPSLFEEAVLSTTGSCKITPDASKVETIYLAHFLNALKPHMNKIASQGVQPFLNMKTIKEFVITIPVRREQLNFARIIQRFERLRSQQREATRQAEHLFQTLLHRAFCGEL